MWVALAVKESVEYRFLAGCRLFKRKSSFSQNKVGMVIGSVGSAPEKYISK